MELTTNNFTELYLEQKKLGKRDKEIAVMFDMSVYELSSIKKFLNVPKFTCRKNYQGLSNEELLLADQNGIGRRLALRRKREYGWSNIDCITTPSKKRKKRL